MSKQFEQFMHFNAHEEQKSKETEIKRQSTYVLNLNSPTKHEPAC